MDTMIGPMGRGDFDAVTRSSHLARAPVYASFE